jgi:hypothetical protein
MNARDRAAYGLGVSIAMVEFQAAHNAKNIVMDCLNGALTFVIFKQLEVKKMKRIIFLIILLCLSFTMNFADTGPQPTEVPFGAYIGDGELSRRAGNEVNHITYLKRVIEKLSNIGVDTVWVNDIKLEHVNNYTEACHQNGVKLILKPAVIDVGVHWKDGLEELRKRVEALVNAVNNSSYADSIIGWSLADEPFQGTKNKEDWRALDMVRSFYLEKDPNRFVTAMWRWAEMEGEYGILENAKYSVYNFDLYPFVPNPDCTENQVIKRFKTYIENVIQNRDLNATDAKLWITTQAAMDSLVREPTRAETRWQIWEALRAGYQGFTPFIALHDGICKGMLDGATLNLTTIGEGVKDAYEKIKPLKDVIFRWKKSEAVAVWVREDKVDIQAFYDPTTGKRYLVMVNPNLEESVSFTFDIESRIQKMKNPITDSDVELDYSCPNFKKNKFEITLDAGSGVIFEVLSKAVTISGTARYDVIPKVVDNGVALHVNHNVDYMENGLPPRDAIDFNINYSNRPGMSGLYGSYVTYSYELEDGIDKVRAKGCFANHADNVTRDYIIQYSYNGKNWYSWAKQSFGASGGTWVEGELTLEPNKNMIWIKYILPISNSYILLKGIEVDLWNALPRVSDDAKEQDKLGVIDDGRAMFGHEIQFYPPSVSYNNGCIPEGEVTSGSSYAYQKWDKPGWEYMSGVYGNNITYKIELPQTSRFLSAYARYSNYADSITRTYTVQYRCDSDPTWRTLGQSSGGAGDTICQGSVTVPLGSKIVYVRFLLNGSPYLPLRWLAIQVLSSGLIVSDSGEQYAYPIKILDDGRQRVHYTREYVYLSREHKEEDQHLPSPHTSAKYIDNGEFSGFYGGQVIYKFKLPMDIDKVRIKGTFGDHRGCTGANENVYKIWYSFDGSSTSYQKLVDGTFKCQERTLDAVVPDIPPNNTDIWVKFDIPANSEYILLKKVDVDFIIKH